MNCTWCLADLWRIIGSVRCPNMMHAACYICRPAAVPEANLGQTGVRILDTRMIEMRLGKLDRGADCSSASIAADAPRVRARLAAYVAAVVTVLRLMFSQRARTELSNAGRELEYAVNEVSARLALMQAEARGAQVPLCVVSGTPPSACSPKAGTACPVSTRSEL